MKGRKKKPTVLKGLEGNPGKRRLPKDEPMPDSEIPDPPEHLDEYARAEWTRLAVGLHNLRLLYGEDRATFAAYCEAYSRWRHDSRKYTERKIRRATNLKQRRVSV